MFVETRDSGLSVLNEDVLSESLLQACRGAQFGRVSVGVVTRSRVLMSSVHCSTRKIEPMPTGAPICAACLAKVFTATLAAQAARERLLHLDEPIVDQFDSLPDDAHELLSAINPRQLLNHTHGLDGSGLSNVPLTPNGRIDLGQLCRTLRRHRPLSSPGQLYSYSNVGGWLCGALLEHAFHLNYSELIATRLFGPLGIEAMPAAHCAAHRAFPHNICASTGGGLAVPLPGFMEFVLYHLGRGKMAKEPALSLMRSQPVPPPGWSVEVGACLGWKYYGEGWYGHNTVTGDCSACVRIHPDSESALVVASERTSAFVVQGRLFGRLLPEFRNFKLPMPLKPGEQAAQDLRACVGVYRNQATSLSVNERPDTSLALNLLDESGQCRASAPLTPTREGAFLAKLAAYPDFACVQFIDRSARGYEYLWNGRELRRRV